MVGLDVPDAELIVTTVALAIVVTLAVQTTTKPWLGRRLGLDEPVPTLGDAADLSAPSLAPGVGRAQTGCRSPVSKRSKRNG